MNDDHIRELFGEMRDDPVPAESLARVRMAVSASVQARRRFFGVAWFGMAWKAAAVLSVGGCLAMVMLRPRAVAPMPVVAVRPAVIAAEQGALVEPPAPPVAHKRVLKVAAKPVREVQEAPVSHVNVDAGGAHEIRIENPYDPDVVIVLIGG